MLSQLMRHFVRNGERLGIVADHARYGTRCGTVL
jgi:hypothetical protein